jgi:hypothetical protein
MFCIRMSSDLTFTCPPAKSRCSKLLNQRDFSEPERILLIVEAKMSVWHKHGSAGHDPINRTQQGIDKESHLG